MLSSVEMFSTLHHSCDRVSSFIWRVCLPYFLPLQMSSPSGTQTYCNLYIILLLKNADSKYVSQEETLSCARDPSLLFVGFRCILLRFCEEQAPCLSPAHSGGQMESANLREMEQTWPFGWHSSVCTSQLYDRQHCPRLDSKVIKCPGQNKATTN